MSVSLPLSVRRYAYPNFEGGMPFGVFVHTAPQQIRFWACLRRSPFPVLTCEGEIKAEIPSLPTTFTTATPTPTPIIRVQPGVHSFCDGRGDGADRHIVEEDHETGSSSADGTHRDDEPNFYESIEGSYGESDGEGGGGDDGKASPGQWRRRA